MEKLVTEGLEQKLSWEKPERADQAGRFLIVGGPSTELKQVDGVFKALRALGAGEVAAAVPETIARVFSRGHEYLDAIGYEAGFKLSEQGARKLATLFLENDANLLLGVGRNLANQRRVAGIVCSSLKPCVLNTVKSRDCLEMVLNFGEILLANSNLTFIVDVAGLQKIITTTNLLKCSELILKSTSNQKEVMEVLRILDEGSAAKFILIDRSIATIVDSNNSMYYRAVLRGIDGPHELGARFVAWSWWLGPERSVESFYMSVQ